MWNDNILTWFPHGCGLVRWGFHWVPDFGKSWVSAYDLMSLQMWHWWQKTRNPQKHDPFQEFLAPGSEKSGLPLKQKNKKIHSGLLQFAVKLIDTMLHAYMVWGLQTTLQKHCKSPNTNSGTKWRSMDFVRIASLTSHWGLPMIWWVCRCGIDGQTPRNDRNMSHDFQNLGCPQTENMQILQHPVMFCTVKLIDT